MRITKKMIQKARLTLLFTCIVFFIMFISMLLVFSAILVLGYFGFLQNKPQKVPFLLFAIISLIVGIVLTALTSQHILKPFREIMKATNQIASGDYTTRLNLKGLPELKQVSESFNYMAEELGSVEMLRTDFVNNFSHEFKTPIVSVRGFAKLLKQDDLTTDEKNEYLDIIVSESERLTELAANVLQLSKLEQQSILINKTCFNVSEQIRLIVAMMDTKWSNKNIDLILNCEEINICANEELLKQVWINLIDNAIKFSPDYGMVRIDMKVLGQELIFNISDQGEGISPDKIKHIFDKFYQGDTSHAIQGNGLGLTIAKRIITLHEGRIDVKQSDPEGTTFEIRLPCSFVS